MAVPPPPSPPAPASDRPALRRILRAARRDFAAGLDARTRDAALAAIAAQLAPLIAKTGPVAGPIAGYVAQGGEPDILRVLLAAHEAGHAIALPAITRTEMRFGAWHPAATLTPGFSGIPQPDAGEPVEPAILLTPLVGFDRAGNRLGQGGGYYDRWFADHPAAMRIGIAWSVQEVPALDAAPWDVPLHAIVTEKEWIAPS